jgi:hypothetical protein
MITTTITIRGVKLDIQHDGDVIHCVETYSGHEDIYPLLDACMIAELRALLFGRKTAIVEPVYEIGMMDRSKTLAEVNARRGFPTPEDSDMDEEAWEDDEPDLERDMARAEAYGVDR